MDLGQRLRDALRKISGKPYIDEAGVKDLVKELQRILISSDVNVKLVFQLSKNIEKRALESDKREALSLKEHVLKVVYDELVKLMGETYTPRLTPHKVLLLGLYGSGKTTTCGKLAHFYKTRGLKVGLIGADTDRPAAQDQLGQLATKVGVDYYTTREEKDPREIVKKALNEAARAKDEIIIVDSAGRSAFDSDLSREIKDLHSLLKPEEVFLVVSGDIGQVAGK
ncbi:MAG: signal recognition particle receptor subunit alpha, partial [Candidatus Bilamarchaeaceae archaeon]